MDASSSAKERINALQREDTAAQTCVELEICQRLSKPVRNFEVPWQTPGNRFLPRQNWAACPQAAWMRTAIYPGSFDPFTNGHLDVVQRAARLFDR